MYIAVEMVGTLQIRYSDINLSKFTKIVIKKEGRSPSKATWYNLPMICEVGLAEEIGVLQFSVTCNKKQVGTAKLVFKSD